MTGQLSLSHTEHEAILLRYKYNALITYYTIQYIVHGVEMASRDCSVGTVGHMKLKEQVLTQLYIELITNWINNKCI